MALHVVTRRATETNTSQTIDCRFLAVKIGRAEGEDARKDCYESVNSFTFIS